MAELAFARALGLVWPARVDTFRSLPDVDPFWEVRWDSQEKRVKVATDDPPYLLVAHVTGWPPTFEIHGCIVAGWVQRNVPATDPGDKGWKAHFTDIYRLTPINDDFHLLCSWSKGSEGWMCVYCGAKYEGPTLWTEETPASAIVVEPKAPSGRGKRGSRARVAAGPA